MIKIYIIYYSPFTLFHLNELCSLEIEMSSDDLMEARGRRLKVLEDSKLEVVFKHLLTVLLRFTVSLIRNFRASKPLKMGHNFLMTTEICFFIEHFNRKNQSS